MMVLMKALSDDKRCEILQLLRDENMTAGELAKKIRISPAGLSYHLDILKKSGMLISYKEKNFIYYELNTSVLNEIIIWLKSMGGKDNEEKN